MTTPSLWSRLARVLIPTPMQVVLAVLISAIILLVIDGTAILHRVGISEAALQASQNQLHSRFTLLSTSPLASNIALVAFWSVVGLIAYIVCWAGYNLIIEARNEVTLETQYKNLGTGHGPWLDIAVKALCAVVLIGLILTFKAALAFSLALLSPVINQVDVGTVLAAIGGVIVLAVDIYAIFAGAELVLSGWYRPEAFTE